MKSKRKIRGNHPYKKYSLLQEIINSLLQDPLVRSNRYDVQSNTYHLSNERYSIIDESRKINPDNIYLFSLDSLNRKCINLDLLIKDCLNCSSFLFPGTIWFSRNWNNSESSCEIRFYEKDFAEYMDTIPNDISQDYIETIKMFFEKRQNHYYQYNSRPTLYEYYASLGPNKRHIKVILSISV